LQVVQAGSGALFHPQAVHGCTRLVVAGDIDVDPGHEPVLEQGATAVAPPMIVAPGGERVGKLTAEGDPLAPLRLLGAMAEYGCPHRRGHAAGVHDLALRSRSSTVVRW